MSRFSKVQKEIIVSINQLKVYDVISFIREFIHQNPKLSKQLHEVFTRILDSQIAANKDYLIIPMIEIDAIDLLRQFLEVWNYLETNNLVATVNKSKAQSFRSIQVLHNDYIAILSDKDLKLQGKTYITSDSITDLLNHKSRLNEKIIPFQILLTDFIKNNFVLFIEKTNRFKRILLDVVPIIISFISLLMSIFTLCGTMGNQNVNITNWDKKADTLKVELLSPKK
jgi:hypothetical protein